MSLKHEALAATESEKEWTMNTVSDWRQHSRPIMPLSGKHVDVADYVPVGYNLPTNPEDYKQITQRKINYLDEIGK